MKFFTLSALAAAAVVSAVVVVPFLPFAQGTTVEGFALEVRMASTAAGRVQLYYPDTNGGLSEAASSQASLEAGGTPQLYRLPLPGGRYSALRFDPLDRDGTVTIETMRLVAQNGRVVRPIALAEIQAAQQIASRLERDGRLEIVTVPGAGDPQLTLALQPAAELHGTLGDRCAGWMPRALAVLAALAGLLFALDRAPRVRKSIVESVRWLAARPGSAVAIVAAVAVIASAYPVVFLGQSHVSPNFGTHLLYDGFPTLPGSTSRVSVSPQGADVGAMMWAHLPYGFVEHRALAHGELPLWNRYNSLGSPLLGQGQSMLGDPLHVFVVLFDSAAWAWDVKFLVAKWLFAAGLGWCVFALTRHLGAALIVSVAAPFVGFFVYRISHAAFFSLCYAPWPLYCWLRVTQAGDRRGVVVWAAALVVANLALMNSGTVKEAYLLLLTMNLCGASILLANDAPWRARLGKLAALGWAGVIFVLLTVPIWATFLHTLESARTNYDIGAAFQIQPSLLLGAFDEAFYRPIQPLEYVFNPSINFLLALGWLYFLATLRFFPADRAVLVLGAGTLVAFALAFGLVPPAWLAAVPLLGQVQHIDNCFSCVLIVLWSVLAGVGFARAARRLGTPEGRGDLLTVAGLLFAVVFAWLAFRQAAHRGYIGPGSTFSVWPLGQTLPVSEFVWGYLATLLAACTALAVLTRRALAQRALTPAGGLLIALCAGLLLWRQGLQAAAVGFERHVVHPPLRAGFHASSPAMEFVRTAQTREPGRGFGLHENFFMGWTGAYGLEAINSADALMNPRVRELFAVSGVTRGISWDFSVPPERIAAVQPFFDALNVRYYFDRGRDQAVLARSLTPVRSLDLDVWESRTAWPRAFFTDRVVEYADAADLMKKFEDGDGQPFAAVQSADAPAFTALRGELAGRSVTAATNYRLTENTTAFDVRASAPGVVVLSETFWPGDFRAEVNGRRAPVVRLNHAFKGVVVDTPGDHHVIFRCVPKNFPRHLLFCAAGAVLGLLSFLAAWRSSPRPPAA